MLLSEGLKKIVPSIKIEKRAEGEHFIDELKRQDKPLSEIEEIKEKESKTRILGVSTKHIKKVDMPQSKYSRAALR